MMQNTEPKKRLRLPKVVLFSFLHEYPKEAASLKTETASSNHKKKICEILFLEEMYRIRGKVLLSEFRNGWFDKDMQLQRRR